MALFCSQLWSYLNLPLYLPRWWTYSFYPIIFFVAFVKFFL